MPLPDVPLAISEAEIALNQLGASGVVLLANNAGIYPGDPSFEPLLDFLNEREAVVFIHPAELPAEPVAGIPTFTADFLLDTSRAAISLILSGALDKYPKIKFILAHAGGFIPYISYRIFLTSMNEKSKMGQLKATVFDRKLLKNTCSISSNSGLMSRCLQPQQLSRPFLL